MGNIINDYIFKAWDYLVAVSWASPEMNAADVKKGWACRTADREGSNKIVDSYKHNVKDASSQLSEPNLEESFEENRYFQALDELKALHAKLTDMQCNGKPHLATSNKLFAIRRNWLQDRTSPYDLARWEALVRLDKYTRYIE